MPFKNFVAGEILTASDVNSFLGSQAISVFANASARDTAITSPVEGQFAFRTDDDVLEYWNGSAWEEYVTAIEVEYLVIGGGAGGGGGVDNSGGGGGAGAYAPGSLFVVPGAYSLKVGLGGAGDSGATLSVGSTGSFSQFVNLVAQGGGGGGGRNSNGSGGGSGGGGGGSNSAQTNGGSVDNPFGNNGGAGRASGSATQRPGGGGGGAGGAGGDFTGTSTGGAAGAGAASSITGTSVTRAAGGLGGSGNIFVNGAAGAANTGTGGGGSGGNDASGGNGGSGVVIFAVKTGTPVSFSGGVSQTNATVGPNRVYTVTAAGPTDTVTIGNP